MPLPLITVPFLEMTASPEKSDFYSVLVHSNLFNILLVVVILTWVVKKFNLLQMIDNRREIIAGEIEQIEAQKRQALRQLEDVQEKTERLSGEVEQILASAQESAQALSHQILEEAKAEASKIVESTKKRMALEQKAAVKALETRLMEEAIQEAKESLARETDKHAQKRSVEAFLNELTHLNQLTP